MQREITQRVRRFYTPILHLGKGAREEKNPAIYRGEIYSLQILLSRTQARPGRTVKKEQEEISPNHVQKINLESISLPLVTNLV